MKAEFHSIDVGRGDCLFLLLTAEDGERFNIMIDCGTEHLDEVEQFVDDRLNNHIHLLIITHIDNDHIKGVDRLLKRHRYEKKGKARWIIDAIWYNFPRKISSNTLCRLIKKKSIQAAVDHCSFLENNPEWEKVWVSRIDNTMTEVLPGWNNKFGTIRILSPSPLRLEELNKEYQRWYAHKVINRGFNILRNREAYFLEFARYLSERGIDDDHINLELKNLEYLTSEAADPRQKDESVTNGASIAFEWEAPAGESPQRYLFLGDAWHSVIIDSLKHLLQTDTPPETPCRYDLIKLAHHGSSANTNEELLRWVDAPDYWITGYTNATDCHCPAVARIVKEHLMENAPRSHRKIHFTHATQVAKHLVDTQRDWAKKFGASIDFKKDNA